VTCDRYRAQHRRFDPAELTLSTSRDLAAAPDGRLAPVVLDRLDGLATMLARSYPQVGPSRLMSPVAALLSEVARRARSAPSDERQRLVLTVAHLGVLAGHMSFDLGHAGYVDGYFDGELSAVDEAGDSDMRVWALGSWGLGSHRLAKLTPDHVDDLLEARASRGMARNSLRRIRAVLVMALDHADRRERVRRNVARLTSTPEGTFSERRSLTAAEAGALLGSMRGDRLEALAIVGVTMGLALARSRGCRGGTSTSTPE
jgi:hypothetical protein